MSASRKPLGAKFWVLFTVWMLLWLFGIAALSVWRHNLTINLLGEVAWVVALILLRPLNVLKRRAAGAGNKRPEGYSETAKFLVRGRRIVGIGLVLLGLYLFTAGSLSWAIRLFGAAVVLIGILTVSKSFDRIMRIVGIALVPLNVFFLGCLYLDRSHGYCVAWPLYTFVTVALVSGVVWACLLAKAYLRWVSR